MDDRSQLLVATSNPGKLNELRDLLATLPIDLLSLEDIGPVDEVEETGSTFAENAVLKARGYARQTRLLTVADDSGLEILALDNRPGVLSARYGGRDTGFDEKMAKLIGELERSGDERRTARFVSAVAIAGVDGGLLFSAEGVCPGHIAQKARGAGGFGYDPIFVPDGFEETFGELSGAVKQRISHRAMAFRQIIPFLRDFIVI